MGGFHWREDEKRRLAELCERYSGRADALESIAAALGRPVEGVRWQIKRQGLSYTPNGKDKFGTADIAALLGASEGAVRGWIAQGHFEPYLTPRKGYVIHAITPDDLWAWMEKAESWHLWEPERLTDKAMREFFSDLRRGWLTTEQVAEQLHLSVAAVRKLRSDGRLAGVYCKRALWFRIQAVESYRISQSPSLEAEIINLRAEIAQLRQELERRGMLAEGYPVRARYASMEANR